jgi:hypothetical protein
VLVVEVDAVARLTVADLKLQLRAWNMYIKQRNLSREGVDVRLSGNQDAIVKKVSPPVDTSIFTSLVGESNCVIVWGASDARTGCATRQW